MKKQVNDWLSVPVRFSTVSHRFHQGVNALGFPRPTGSQHHHAMAHPLRFKELDDLKHPRRMEDEAGLVDLES